MWRKHCEGLMCGEVQLEGAFDESNARVSCCESSTLTKMVTWGVMWKVRATIALPLSRYSAFEYMVTVTSVFCHCGENILLSVYGIYCKDNILLFSKWLL